jgi:hypothetical protein
MLKIVIGVYDILWERDLRRIEGLITSWSSTNPPFAITGMSDDSFYGYSFFSIRLRGAFRQRMSELMVRSYLIFIEIIATQISQTLYDFNYFYI